MVVEALWTASDLWSLGQAVKALEETVQQWEVEYDFKIKDLMVTLETAGRPVQTVGLVTLVSKNDTTLQFEAGEYEIGPI